MPITSLKHALGWPTNPATPVSGAHNPTAQAVSISYEDLANSGLIYDQNKRRIMQATYDNALRSVETVASAAWRLTAINMRLRSSGSGIPKGLEDLVTSMSGDKVFVFIVVKGKAVTLEDDTAMFPSDVLVTQIRLLQE